MRSRNLTQSFFSTRLAYEVPPVIASDWPLTVYTMSLETPPASNSWWVILDYENVEKRDIIYYHSKSGNQLSFYKKDRGISPSTAGTGVQHLQWASVVVHDVAEYLNSILTNSSDMWYTEKWYNWTSPLAIKVFWWQYSIYTGSLLTVLDTVINLDANSVYTVVLDLTTNTIIGKKNDNVVWINQVQFSTVTTNGTTITSIVDIRPEIFRYKFWDNFEINWSWELSIVNLAIGTSEIADLAVTNAKLAELSVGTSKIQDRSITNIKIQTNPTFSGNVAVIWWTIQLDEATPTTPAPNKANIFVKDLLWVPTPHFRTPWGDDIPMWVNPIITAWGSVVVGPITWGTAVSSITVNDPSVLVASSIVTGISILSWTVTALSVEANITTNWEILFSTFNELWIATNQTGFQFYYHITY